MTSFTNHFLDLVHSLYGEEHPVPLHRPVFSGTERQDLVDCIDSNFVSSVGEKVTEMERRVADFAGAKYSVAVVNGTNALQVALRLVGVKPNTEVIPQALTFIATCNSIAYLGAEPILLDVDRATLGLSPDALKAFLTEHAQTRDDGC